MLLTEQSKQGGPLQGWIAFELGDHPRPILLEGVRACSPGMRALELAGQFPGAFIAPPSAFTHAGASGSHPLSESFTSCLHIQLDLGILLHDPLLLALR